MTARQHRRAVNHNLQTEMAESRSPTFGGVRSLEGKPAVPKERAVRSSQSNGVVVICANNPESSSCRRSCSEVTTNTAVLQHSPLQSVK